jgi:hypothetical protein
MFRTVVFHHTFENEWRFDDHNTAVAPGARDLAEGVARELGKSVNVITPVEQHSYYGWAFEVKFAGCRFVNVLNPADEECYLTVQLCWYWLHAFLRRRPRPRFEAYCLILEQALVAIPQISGVVWENYRS